MTSSALVTRVEFGYHPVVDELDIVLARVNFSRGLVADEAITDLVDRVPSCRSLWDAGVDLPVGIYWFDGIEEPLLFQVGDGRPAGPATSVDINDLTDDHPLANAFAWAEHFWAQARSVPAPVFREQDPAVTVPGGVDVLVRGRRFVGGHWSYSVFHEGRTQTLLANKLAPVADERDPVAWVRGQTTSVARFGATLTRGKLRGRFADTLYSFRATRTTFRPYQFKPVLKLLQTGKARLLIADEVGLGKTIEAGLIWTELEARREADRVLIVCPSSLLSKWKDEMEERFGFILTELDIKGLDDFLERFMTGRLPKRQAYICSLERLRTWHGLETFEAAPPEFDLVIVDEAHAMRNSETKSYRLGAQLSEWADALVFLTATPINLRQEDLLHLLELLAPEDYGDLADLAMRLEPNEVLHDVGRLVNAARSDRAQRLQALSRLPNSAYGQTLLRRPDYRLLVDVLGREPFTPTDVVEARRLLADLNSLSTVITRTKKAEVDDRKAVRQPTSLAVTWCPAESSFYAQFLAWCQARAAAADMPIYFAMQMPLRLASACLPMAAHTVLTATGASEVEDEDAVATSEVPPHPELIAAARALADVEDSKFTRLRPSLRNLVREGRRVLLFTFSKPTLRYLASRLSSDMRVAVMHGGVSREDRRRIMIDFRAGAYDIVLANRVASEGLDFEFCSAVVNYDLPWNPMEIEQRIGRIDRIGQQEEKLLIINCYNEETIDERILMRVLERINIFESSIGALEPIIAAQMPSLQAAFDFQLDPEQRDHKVQQVLAAVESQRAELLQVSDASSSLLVSNDVDVSGLEDDLVRTGRYVGQRELGLLLQDWAFTDQAPGTSFSDDGGSLTVRGNLAMAERVEALARQGQRSRTEIERLASDLRAELPIHFVLDQEHSRAQGGTLLTATSPLVMAAVDVPGHRQARFANVQVTDTEHTVSEGLYIVVLGQALSRDHGRDEIWGSAVDDSGRRAPAEVTDLLLAGLARGALTEGRPTYLSRDHSRAASRARDLLDRRHQEEQHRRDEEYVALRETRRVVITEQYERRLQTIERRRQTAVERNRRSSAVRLFDAQRRRAAERHAALIIALEGQAPPDIRLEPLAVCLLEVTRDT